MLIVRLLPAAYSVKLSSANIAQALSSVLPVKLRLRLCADWIVPAAVLVSVAALMMPLLVALVEAIILPELLMLPVVMVAPRFACSMPELVRLAELLVSVVLASKVPALVMPLPMA